MQKEINNNLNTLGHKKNILFDEQNNIDDLDLKKSRAHVELEEQKTLSDIDAYE